MDKSQPRWDVRIYQDDEGRETVHEWLVALERSQPSEAGRVRHYIDLLEEFGVHLSEPYTRQLKGKIRELRPGAWRVTYFADPARRLILLTSFRKSTRTTPKAEITKAEKLMKDWTKRMGTK
ncbi:MAG: type II toxin-antitoxin system RelE/ParE family toxin [Actinobacteria bacterium]|nr:type II toxin-antitoxin system RelE/ParE family toxin [Actinomycetota bacterium]